MSAVLGRAGDGRPSVGEAQVWDADCGCYRLSWFVGLADQWQEGGLKVRPGAGSLGHGFFLCAGFGGRLCTRIKAHPMRYPTMRAKQTPAMACVVIWTRM